MYNIATKAWESYSNVAGGSFNDVVVIPTIRLFPLNGNMVVSFFSTSGVSYDRGIFIL